MERSYKPGDPYYLQGVGPPWSTLIEFDSADVLRLATEYANVSEWETHAVAWWYIEMYHEMVRRGR